MKNKLIIFTLLAGIYLLIAGCGQTGPLTLPGKQPPWPLQEDSGGSL